MVLVTVLPEFKPYNGSPFILILGSGPIGLLLSIHIKLICPNVSILVLDKYYPNFSRSHGVIIKEHAFNGYPDHPLFNNVVREVFSQSMIRTNEFQQLLVTLALSIGIAIQNRFIETEQQLLDLPTQYKTARIIVGADGSHSIVRHTIFNNELRHDIDMRYLAEIKYDVIGPGKSLSWISNRRAFKEIRTIATEHIGSPSKETGKTPVTARIFIDKESYDQMIDVDINYKNPASLSDTDKIPMKVHDKIYYWLKNKAQKVGEIRVPGSERITATKIGAYASKKFVHHDENRDITWCLVGDASVGTPFFSGLTAGIAATHQLADAIYRVINGLSPPLIDMRRSVWKRKACSNFSSMNPNFVEYCAYQLRQSEINIAKAIAKSAAVGVGISVVKSSAATSDAMKKSGQSCVIM